MTKLHKNQLAFSGVFLLSLTFGLILFVPTRIHAEGVYHVLSSTSPDSFGGHVQSIWKQLLNVVNSLVVIVLIIIAFAEMLRININTYGVKKMLPTLIMAVVAANFSFMFCRLVIDVANVSTTLVSCINADPNGGAGGSCTGDPKPFLNSKAGLDTSQLHFVWTPSSFGLGILQNDVYILLLFAEGVILLMLAFLFIVRNWILYALVIFSPLAFMAMVLPQTKKYFNQWWDMMIKWSFMPLVSFVFLALANSFAGILPDSTFPLMGAIFVGACLYGALTVPFKLGGKAMENFYKGTGAKFLAGKTKEYGTVKAQGVGLRAWNNVQQYGLDAQRGKNALGKTKFGQAIGRNFPGSALIKAKANLEHEDERSKGLVEGIKARHYEGQGNKLQMEREYNKNRQGEIKEFEAYSLLNLVQKGLDARKAANGDKSKYDRDFEQLIEWRLGSGLARKKMATAEQISNAMVSDGVTSALQGSLVQKGSEKDQKMKKIDAEMADVKAGKIKNMDGSAMTEEQKKARMDELGAQRKAEEDRAKEDWKRTTGMSDEELSSLKELIEYAVTEEASSEELKTKQEKDVKDKSAMQIVGIHEVAELAEEVEKAAAAFKKLPAGAADLQEAVKKGTKSLSTLTEEEKKLYTASSAQYGEYLTQKARAETVLQQHGIIGTDERFEGTPEQMDSIVQKAVDRRDKYAEALKKRFTNKEGKVNIPLYLRRQISIDERGEVTLSKLDRTTYTRFGGVANSKTNGRVEGYASLQTDALANILQNGDKKDGITADMVRSFATGQLVLSADGKPDPNKNSRISAAWAAASKKLNDSTQAGDMAHAIIGTFDDAKVQKIAKEWVEKEQPKHPVGSSGPGSAAFRELHSAVTSGASGTALHSAMTQYYNSRSANTRGDLNGALRRHIPQTVYT